MRSSRRVMICRATCLPEAGELSARSGRTQQTIEGIHEVDARQVPGFPQRCCAAKTT
jgi:hypothetical protein